VKIPTVIDEEMRMAVRHHHAGHLAEAEAILRRIVTIEPTHARAWHQLGQVMKDARRWQAALPALCEAVRLDPHSAEARFDLGLACMENGDQDEALAQWARVVELQPDHAEAYAQIARAFRIAGRVDEAIAAIAACTRAIESRKIKARESCNVGNALSRQERNSDAIAAYMLAIELDPTLAPACHGLSVVLEREGRMEDALWASTRAVQLDPKFADAHNGLGVALRRLGRIDDAIEAFGTAIRLGADRPQAANNLGAALSDGGRLDEAIAVLMDAVQTKPDFAAAHNNLGNALRQAGRLDEAVASYRKAVDIAPQYALAHSNLLYALHGHPGYGAAQLLAEHEIWNEKFAKPLQTSHRAHENGTDPDRRLRVGYISPDFRSHPVGFFLLPLFSQHDQKEWEVFAYSDVIAPDQVTRDLRAGVDTWREIAGLSDERAAHLVRADRIDVLVDLTMHTADTRLLVFARKPAPVQVTYLAYCSTTGMSAMDYRLTDAYLDPPDAALHYSERSAWLQTYWCYRPAVDSLDVVTTPALATGHPTFGCLNDFSKISLPALSLWSRVLVQLPSARLLLHAPPGECRRRVRELVAREGVDPERVSFVGRIPLRDYLELHHRIDVALDPLPYGGGRTTCDALWMGVPVVSLIGDTAVGRGGASILSNIGLPELLAKSADEYVQIAVNLAGDAERLNTMRLGLRERMKSSPLMHAPRFARTVEAAFRRMWQTWCRSDPAASKVVVPLS
jgi:protein O-GlcNAc transferase